MSTVDELIDLIDKGDEKGALAFLEQAPELATGESEREGQLARATPLHWAAHRNHVQLCRRLCELGADIHANRARWWRTPLAWGADAGSADAVELLLSLGAEVNQDAYGNTTALHAVAQGGSTSGRRDPAAYRRTAEVLLAHGADMNRIASGDGGQSPLGDAIRRGNVAVIEVLQSHGAKYVPYAT
jgi:ankyrin repeat protein